MSGRKRWNELTPRQQTLVLVGVSIELSLTATALVDLARRPTDQLRGRKLWWFLGCLVQPVGPVIYLVAGPVHRGSRAPAPLAG